MPIEHALLFSCSLIFFWTNDKLSSILFRCDISLYSKTEGNKMAHAEKGNTVTINFTGTLEDGTIFDSTLEDLECSEDECCDDGCLSLIHISEPTRRTPI